MSWERLKRYECTESYEVEEGGGFENGNSGGADDAGALSGAAVAVGEDATRDGLAETPERVEKAMAFLTQGYAMDVRRC